MTGAVELDEAIVNVVLDATGANAVIGVDLVQRLWSDYGQIVRCHLDGAESPSVIVKHVAWPAERDHPRGWATDRSHQRKLRSYQVETAWYERHAPRCGSEARVPQCLAVEGRPDGVLIVLEDLDAAGFDGRRHELTEPELDACLRWLATFHATFLGAAPDGLWPTGTYWHLATRPDELGALDDESLRAAAAPIDRLLAEARFQTFVHGDAKVANFCFSADGRSAAAVDFQYVGGGCGMKDLAYFVGSCLDERDAERHEERLLDRYFELMELALADLGSRVDCVEVEADWRPLYRVAWTDFHRFLKGWSPGHWKLTDYSERVAREVVATVAGER
ncbi:MAG: phosphotransferase [Acidimicrobiales bacterium]